MTIVLGIDGGGSNLRAAIADVSDPAQPRVLYEARRGPANPGAIGREASAARIHDAIAEARAAVDAPIAAVGIGIAGASPEYADEWLRATIAAVLPGVPVATATDIEIALIGAHGQRRGAIIVAGTGSVALAIGDDGVPHQTGGWGYLLGDEGSGYWIGLHALQAVTRYHDTRHAAYAPLAKAVMGTIGVTNPREVIGWTYRGGAPDVKAIAALAEVVLMMSASGDEHSTALIDDAADTLGDLLYHALTKCGTSGLPIAFGGGLLMSENVLVGDLIDALKLPARPEPRFSPVIGACLLAKGVIGL